MDSYLKIYMGERERGTLNWTEILGLNCDMTFLPILSARYCDSQ